MVNTLSRKLGYCLAMSTPLARPWRGIRIAAPPDCLGPPVTALAGPEAEATDQAHAVLQLLKLLWVACPGHAIAAT